MLNSSLYLLATLIIHRVRANQGDPELYAYFETPLEDDVGAIGPSNWRDLEHIHENQCGGYGQTNGFGQSPVIFSEDVAYYQCHTDMSGYEPLQGDCNWSDLEFTVGKHGLRVVPKTEHHHQDDHGSTGHTEAPVCHMGFINIPQSDKQFKAVEIRLQSGSEHNIDGFASSFELQVLHQEESGETQAAFGVLVELAPIDWTQELNLDEGAHPFLENLLNAWRTDFWETEDFCVSNEKGTEIFSTDSVFKSKQKLLLCPEPGTFQEYMAENPSSSIPRGSSNPEGLFPNLYTDLVEDYGTMTYEGSLTAPPCTENVYWNVADVTMPISLNQYRHMISLISCFTEKSTCELASAASEFGRTNRPPQDLNGREIVHRCPYGSNVPDWEPKKAPKSPKYKKKKGPKPYYALLFPWFITALGIVVYFLLSRYVHALPYTAVLFLLGTFIGAGVSNVASYDQLTKSAMMWENINGELLLIAFLPGLLFKDAYGLDFHLFQNSLGQTLLMAFPMVLGGTTLLASVAYYILPYGWTFNFCMTFGAILSATDPVAVSALLNELGAPPRLKMHISGESLLNDGSAIVFYVIFKTLFLYELGIGGEKIGVGQGVLQFIEMSLGAAAVGIAFGLALSICLYFLNRRFSVEESIVQVTATICIAYLCFYVAEALLHMSGVLAVVCCGVVTKAFASTLIIDQEMMAKFWGLVEHLLNSVLFALGGVVWGAVISNLDDTRPEKFDARDWGYLFLVFISMTVIRFFLFALFFPIISRIGLKSSWQEMVFQSFAGLRGAVGIALAIALDSEVIHDTVRTDPRRKFTSQLFGITGGISLLTLFVNGVLSAPLLRKLGLNRASEERTNVIKRYDQHLKEHMLFQMIKALGMKQYANLDLDIIKRYIPTLSDISSKDLKIAIRKVKDSTPLHLYHEPNLLVFKPFLTTEEFNNIVTLSELKFYQKFLASVSLVMNTRKISIEVEENNDQTSFNPQKLRELRLVYVELLRNGYKTAMDEGFINVRDSFVVFRLNKSVAFAEDQVANGNPIDDWKTCYSSRMKIEAKLSLASAFIRVHSEARQTFAFDFGQSSTLSQVEQQVIKESSQQIQLAEAIFNETSPVLLKQIMSLKISSDLLNQAARFMSSYVDRGLLKPQEGEHYFEHFGHAIRQIRKHEYDLMEEEEDLDTFEQNYA
jgi:NhaP-type Na+/H+ or K+/H+ antiporter